MLDRHSNDFSSSRDSSDRSRDSLDLLLGNSPPNRGFALSRSPIECDFVFDDRNIPDDSPQPEDSDLSSDANDSSSEINSDDDSEHVLTITTQFDIHKVMFCVAQPGVQKIIRAPLELYQKLQLDFNSNQNVSEHYIKYPTSLSTHLPLIQAIQEYANLRLVCSKLQNPQKSIFSSLGQLLYDAFVYTHNQTFFELLPKLFSMSTPYLTYESKTIVGDKEVYTLSKNFNAMQISKDAFYYFNYVIRIVDSARST